MSKDFELILNNVLLALQLCLGVWQLTKLTPVGALIQGVVSWLLRPFGLSETYSTLQELDGRVFKKANCYVLQPEIPSARRRSVELGSQERLDVRYLGKEFVLESHLNMLFVNGEMCYYISPTVWEELHVLEKVLVEEEKVTSPTSPPDLAGRRLAGRRAGSVVLKGHREFWEEVSTGGIMSFDEVLDGLILHNQRLSLRLPDNRLLPVDLSVSEEILLKILNLIAVSLQTQEGKVYWLISTSLSFITAILEFITPLRVWLYTNINVFFCSIMHSMCDLLPRPRRRQVYSLCKWVANLKPTNDIQLKIQRGNIRAIIAGGSKINRQGASLVPWLNVVEEEEDRRHVISDRFHCNAIDIDMMCTYYVGLNRCQIEAPTLSVFMVECRSMEEYRRIITLVSRMAEHGCGSLKSCGPDNKVSVRGFRESVLCYVKSGFPPVYELQLENVVLT